MKNPLIASPSLNSDWNEYRIFLQEDCLNGGRDIPYADLTDILTWIENKCNYSGELLQIIEKIADK